MILAGLQKNTLVDYPGRVACTVFTAGCNFRCPYCHNPELVTGKPKQMPEDYFWNFLEERREWLDGVCVTGGEPLIHEDAPEFLKKIKDYGFDVKLDTNGSFPDRLRECLPFADYVAMDIKAPLEKYESVAGVDARDSVKKSVEIIRSSGKEYEFRTTVVPEFYSEEDALAIGEWLKGSNAYYLQQFVSSTDLVNPELKGKPGYPPDELRTLCNKLKPFFKTCEARGI
ncbi:anaerobic ribonucleoside-triphosphate reductase activating protein [Candidatus Micrarchaeota archaeon CG10_big_fil_rev_8_21_14_0_10_54_18]|nr:MAG: anaerobic ribonucleoside-triphosphate reductase activating protein [Candidatus Micrarchaeota archaeon CG1_02_55_41]PIO03222.1 MAG: anaerobic ribonucleoside-triphosphate reductase activating protein [Candidatus Micrarchaeota archaeon CG09_land_8_20_14_0_10_55_25]PJD00862.1 MAG: anaerobic ribonucleoside-triphosphate reductase activating protein [Candidatus Micrarchaeota archaeon CG10_big_fil_rev_8_21_14_0_10_54_18]